MVTSGQEFYASLIEIAKNGNKPNIAVLNPSTESTYEVDLNSRTVEEPEFLSVQYDHTSETIYFSVDRYYDNMDLSDTCCIIQYVNALKQGRVYIVPFYDIQTCKADNKMLIPWCIEGEATKAAGEISYSIRFFKIDNAGAHIIYNLNTVPAHSQILVGMNVKEYYPVSITEQEYNAEPNTYYILNEDGEYVLSQDRFSSSQVYYVLGDGTYEYEADKLDAIYDRLNVLEGQYVLYWTEA